MNKKKGSERDIQLTEIEIFSCLVDKKMKSSKRI